MKMTLKMPGISQVFLKTALGVLYFLFIYSIQFLFIPGAIGTRVVLGLFGMVLSVCPIINNLRRGELKLNKDILNIFISLFIFLCVSLFSNMINGTTDKSMILYSISLVVIFFAAYAVIRATKYVYQGINVSFELVSQYIIYVVVVQMIIAVSMFMIPAFKELLLGITFQLDYSLDIFSETEGFRLLGFGAIFFAAGVINGFTLILIAALYKKQNPPIPHGWLVAFFIIITVVGAMMSRTTLVASGLAIALIVWPSRGFRMKITKRFWIGVRTIILILVIIFLVSLFLPVGEANQIMALLEFGFEMFYNYFDSGKMSSASTDHLVSMYDVYPDNLKTWIIGDGLWISNPLDVTSYYAGVDVGYTRLVFYFGLIGLVVYFVYQALMLLAINRIAQNKYRTFLFVLFVYILILNLKGFVDLTSLISPFLFLAMSKKIYA